MAIDSVALERVKPGDAITAEKWNTLIDAVNRSRITLGQNVGLAMQKGRWGNMLRATGRIEPGYIAKTTTSFAPRSGGTCGSGSVRLQDMTSAGVLTDAAEPTALAWNFTSCSTGIASNVYVWVQIDTGGEFIITAAEG